MDACQLDFSALDLNAIEPDVKIQLPTEVWSNAWTWDMSIDSLDSVLAKLPLDGKSPVSSQRVSSEDWESEGSSASGSIGHSFGSAPSLSTMEFAPPPRPSPGSQEEAGVLSVDTAPLREKKPKKKAPVAAPAVPAHHEDKDLDYTKYKTRLCRNWQQTGKCPYGDACVYAHGAKELRGEQENAAVVTSLSKLADQLAKHLGAFPGAGAGAAAPLRPLHHRKPKAGPKKPAAAPSHFAPAPSLPMPMQYPVAAHTGMPMYTAPAYYGRAMWMQP